MNNDHDFDDVSTTIEEINSSLLENSFVNKSLDVEDIG